MLQLRRITDQVPNLAEVRKRGNEVARSAYERSNEAARMAYEYAMNHRKATTAVLLGTGIAAALIWMVNKNGGYPAMRRKVLQRVRRPAVRSRRRVANATK
jgi:hypothetical protein